MFKLEKNLKLEGNVLVVILFLFFFVLSAFYLSWVEARDSSWDYQKQWSAFYFENAKASNDASFFIENWEGQSIQYHWTLLDENQNTLEQGELLLGPGEKKLIELKDKTGKLVITYNDKEVVLKRQAAKTD